MTGATFKQSSLSEVPLTSYMRQVAKLNKEPLITPFEEANIGASGAMSLFGTSKHPISEPKAKYDKKRRRKKNPSSFEPNASKEVTADATQSLDASMSAEEQENQPQTADAKKRVRVCTIIPIFSIHSESTPENDTLGLKYPMLTLKTLDFARTDPSRTRNIVTEDENMADKPHDDAEFVDSGIQSMGDVSLESLNQAKHDSPYDTESDIKFVKRFKAVTNDEEHLFTSKEHSDTKEESKLESIPDDEVGSPSAFQTSDTDESLSKPLLSKSEERDDDNILDQLDDLKAFADKPSDTLSHLQEEVISLTTKVGQMESNITRKVSEEIHSPIPALITEALKQQLPGLLIDALQSTLHTLLKDLIKESVDTFVEEKLPIFNEQVQQSFKAQTPELFIQPMNKELIAFNKLEANRFVHLQEELSKLTDLASLLQSAEVL
ncbi:hypothetical protein Tco_1214613 [Tanacetum coccineum]